MNDNLSFKNIFKRETKLATYIVICMTIVVLSLSYAMFFKVDGNSKNQVVEAGDLVFTYENSSQTITSEGKESCFMPMSVEETKLYLGTCDYKLSVQNTGSLKGAYTLRLIANEANTIEAHKLKVVLRRQEGESFQVVNGYENGKTVSELTDGILIEDEEMEQNSTTVYSVSLIIDESVATEEDTSKVLSYKIEGTGLVHESQDIHTDPTYCEKNPQTSACEILAKGETDELKFDNTPDNNLRYIGANPNNYVSFNNELWRIIGVFNNIDDGTGTKETRLKIIKNEPYNTGTATVWDSENSNDWTTASLQEELNGNYLTSIENSYQEMIGNAKWNLGGLWSSTYIPSSIYTSERGTTVSSGHATEWIGKIGLMYPSDYGYATSGGSTTNRETCLNTELLSWREYDNCFNNDWLYDSSSWQWTLTSDSFYSDNVYGVSSSGAVTTLKAFRSGNAVFPALYLSSNVKISGGEGTEDSPFTLSL